MSIPADRKYAASHEWCKVENDQLVTVGISDHAQELLGDLVYIELPEVGRVVEAEEACAVVESVKAASDVYSPIAGEVVEVNQSVVDGPEAVNTDPYGNWLFKVKPADVGAVDALLDASGYAAEIGA
ncbi:glycine cleavage system protein GcvH [Leeia sp. TBRC 13508]|uniref:Glycine cleavage system H protein n=1 Tax=Leeia speluncae TaxID=2884804 RepID=A0ABS8D617_9NEIS|nr:glycine cleavage system protein GcvH [Leeia speluncae]MCB6183416.1 glycine cleavage system protein GcvH [Leeia speluncae]